MRWGKQMQTRTNMYGPRLAIQPYACFVHTEVYWYPSKLKSFKYRDEAGSDVWTVMWSSSFFDPLVPNLNSNFTNCLLFYFVWPSASNMWGFWLHLLHRMKKSFKSKTLWYSSKYVTEKIIVLASVHRPRYHFSADDAANQAVFAYALRPSLSTIKPSLITHSDKMGSYLKPSVMHLTTHL